MHFAPPHRRPRALSSARLTVFSACAAAAACAARLPPGALAARSTVGALSVAALERELPAGASDETRRRAAEDWLVERALAREARRLQLDRTPAARALVTTRRDDALLALVEMQLDRSVAAPDASAVSAFLREHQAETAGAEKLSLRQVFRRVPRQAGASEREQARARMEALRARLLGGEDFARLAEAESDSETAKFGGLITPVARGQLAPAVDAVVWRLGVGEISAVVETPVGLHVFRLEARLPPEPLTPEQAQAWARHRLTTEARAALRRERFATWRRAARAVYTPEILAQPRPAHEAVVLRLDGFAWTARDVEAQRASLNFAARRLRAPTDVLEAEAWRRLALWHAHRTDFADGAPARDALQRAERQALAQLAAERRVARWLARVPEGELRATYDVAPERFAEQARLRVRILFVPAREARALREAFDTLDALARDVRAGKRDFAQAARELSHDPSAETGGDLGWVAPKDMQEWPGPTCVRRLAALPTGELSAPLLVESYREARLEYEPAGYLLARVEERRDPNVPRFEDVREQVAEVYATRHVAEAQAALRADVLREIEAEILVGAR